VSGPVAEPRELRVPVGDGDLVVAEFGPADGPVVLALHGVTSSSRAWLALARNLPEARILAPDLRGRGRSRDLPPSTGLRHHAEDLSALVDALGLGRVPVAGHSMGAFVAVSFAARRPDAVESLLLVDGGLPLPKPAGIPDDGLTAAVLGPVLRRLETEYPDRDAYLGFWRSHPAFADDFGPEIAAYAEYDLVGEPPHLRPATAPAAIAADALEIYGPEWYLDALAGLGVPVRLLRSPLGLLAEPDGLYGHLGSPPEAPVPVIDVPGTNHYTILMTDPGAGIVADALRPALTRSSEGHPQ